MMAVISDQRGASQDPFSQREKEGPAAQRWEVEGFRPLRSILNRRNPSPSHAFGAGPSLSLRERCSERDPCC